LRRGGVLVEYGNPLSFRGTLQLLAKSLVLNLLPNGRRIKGYGAGFVLLYRKPFLEDWATLFRLLAEGKIQPVISSRFPLLEAPPQANALLESGQVVGNLILVTPESPSVSASSLRHLTTARVSAAFSEKCCTIFHSPPISPSQSSTVPNEQRILQAFLSALFHRRGFQNTFQRSARSLPVCFFGIVPI
jgi:Zinc-binding dehydrogenase